MQEYVKTIASWSAGAIEMAGISIIVAVAGYALFVMVVGLIKRSNLKEAFQTSRQSLGQGILLGLEFLVAADIIHTVAVELTWESIGVLAVVVVIRTFLSFTLDVELTGSWPWHASKSRDPDLKP
ncbi:DUF1622 domain-containing protein [Allohahella sp. A8]|uniref:DUF1622 domain-containing protein n=1 Tax=Allohahella sp. A8 TaxID=3141461 RepID=UPI000C0A4176|nr:hypothetical protein [Hahellaceae bacterium]|tara:strand:- start:49028 stop:49402 length:375 start_codon:yes stop_codon:yes gene_type:complete